MGESAVATFVRTHDADLYASALFAPEPIRSQLMALYSFDIELSRAVVASREPMIAAMRLQWWRDVAVRAEAGGPAPAHETAGPFHTLLRATVLVAADVEPMIRARERELDGLADETGFDAWSMDRFGSMLGVAAKLLTSAHEPSVALARRVGSSFAVGFAIRTALPLATSGAKFFLPGLGAEDRTALTRGTTTEGARAMVGRMARRGIEELAAVRAKRSEAHKRALPVFLAAWRTDRILAHAIRADFSFAGAASDDPGIRRPLTLLWRALSGRW